MFAELTPVEQLDVKKSKIKQKLSLEKKQV